jgi:3-phenylpropionate/trans-cinnamate dioxygenase ferredoxin component
MRITVCKASEIKPGQGKPFRVGDKSIAIFNSAGKYYAIDDYCSHMGAPLSGGMLAGKEITCEWHGATFDLESGRATCAPAKGDICAYQVFLSGEDLEIEIDV